MFSSPTNRTDRYSSTGEASYQQVKFHLVFCAIYSALPLFSKLPASYQQVKFLSQSSYSQVKSDLIFRSKLRLSALPVKLQSSKNNCLFLIGAECFSIQSSYSQVKSDLIFRSKLRLSALSVKLQSSKNLMPKMEHTFDSLGQPPDQLVV